MNIVPDFPPGDEDSGRRRMKKGLFRELVTCIVGLWIAGAMLRTFFGESFVIQTSSMEPTITGRVGAGDRIVISKLHPLIERPSRFDILSFEYPNNRSVHYMKRLAGFGGEQVLIQGGDVWMLHPRFGGTLEEGLARGHAAILRKPRRIVESIIEGFPVLSPSECADAAAVFSRSFQVTASDAPRWTTEQGAIKVSAGDETLARTKDRIRDTVREAGADWPSTSPGAAAGIYPVGDLSLRVAVNPEDGSRIILEINDGAHGVRVRAVCDVRAHAPDELQLELDGVVIGRTTSELAVGRWSEFRLDSIDDRVTVQIGGGVRLERDFSHREPPLDRDLRDRETSAAFGASGNGAKFRPIALYRDIHYTQDGQHRFLVPAGELLFLGDHAAQSVDSRSWKRVAIEVLAKGLVLEGDSLGVSARDLHLHDGNPWMEADGSYAFVDHLGTIHSFKGPADFRKLGSWATPYVPRENVVGRGLCIVTPLDRARWLR